MSNKEIKEYDDRENLVYIKYPNGNEYWWEYDENNNLIYSKKNIDLGFWEEFEYWREYDENNNEIHYRDSERIEYWYKWNKNKKIIITEKEYKEIQYNIKIKEYNSRTKCSRFELMEI